MTKVDRRIAEAQRLARAGNEKYGDKTGWTAGMPDFDHGIVPSGSLTLDYMLGLGGYRLGSAIEVFGVPTIGKTSLFGYNGLVGAQDQGLLTAIIAVEPEFDEDWAIRNGVNPAYNIVYRPDTSEDAFDILRDLVFDGTVQWILFDSLGALSSEGDQSEKGVKRFGGASGLISWAIPRIMPRAYKNDVGVMFINQVRAKTDSQYAGVFESPGGWAAKHAALMRIQVKPGKDKYTAKVDGQDKMVGRQIAASIVKGKAHGAMGKVAKFDWYFEDVEGLPFGIDQATDMLNVGKLTKVIEGAGAWIKHPIFPKGQLNGKTAFANWIAENPDKLPELRKEVLDVMHERQTKRAARPQLKAVK